MEVFFVGYTHYSTIMNGSSVSGSVLGTNDGHWNSVDGFGIFGLLEVEILL